MEEWEEALFVRTSIFHSKREVERWQMKNSEARRGIGISYDGITLAHSTEVEIEMHLSKIH